MNCVICKSNKLISLGIPGIYSRSITSEPRIFECPPTLFFCAECNHIQNEYNYKLRAYIESIYSEYLAHYLSNGYEQLVFPQNLPPRPRTYHALELCKQFLPKKGKLLDFGCGSGAALLSASKILPGWTLYGYDVSSIHKNEILKITDVQKFFSGQLSDIKDKPFDLIILWQVLEHLPEPEYYLLELKKLLSDDGMLLLSIPDIDRNPFDLAIIDHCSHFSFNSIISLFNHTGFGIKIDGREWFHNLLTFLISKRRGEEKHQILKSSTNQLVIWLQEVAKFFNMIVGNGNYSIFGTGMSSFWLLSQMEKKPIYFIDEDWRRNGKIIENVKIIHPQNLENLEIPILLPFLQGTGLTIVKKLCSKYSKFQESNFLLPPDLPPFFGDNKHR